MELAAYTDLIKHLPYKEQSFETNKETWAKYKKHPLFGEFYKELFTSARVSFSRAELFNVAQGDFSKAIFSIILWGYPRNMRGNSFRGILENVSKLKTMLSVSKKLTDEEFKNIKKQLAGTGIGLSTLTKILYFFNITLDESRCLILDSRILTILRSGKFKELKVISVINDFNKDKHYSIYNKVMADIANENGYSVDQLELFLFMFGNNLKMTNSH